MCISSCYGRVLWNKFAYSSPKLKTAKKKETRHIFQPSTSLQCPQFDNLYMYVCSLRLQFGCAVHGRKFNGTASAILWYGWLVRALVKIITPIDRSTCIVLAQWFSIITVALHSSLFFNFFLRFCFFGCSALNVRCFNISTLKFRQATTTKKPPLSILHASLL